MQIYEPHQRNAGIIEGKFLEYSQVRKPGSSIDNPEYYTPADFAIGATIEVFSRKFNIVGKYEVSNSHVWQLSGRNIRKFVIGSTCYC